MTVRRSRVLSCTTLTVMRAEVDVLHTVEGGVEVIWRGMCHWPGEERPRPVMNGFPDRDTPEELRALADALAALPLPEGCGL